MSGHQLLTEHQLLTPDGNNGMFLETRGSWRLLLLFMMALPSGD